MKQSEPIVTSPSNDNTTNSSASDIEEILIDLIDDEVDQDAFDAESSDECVPWYGQSSISGFDADDDSDSVAAPMEFDDDEFDGIPLDELVEEEGVSDDTDWANTETDPLMDDRLAREPDHNGVIDSTNSDDPDSDDLRFLDDLKVQRERIESAGSSDYVAMLSSMGLTDAEFMDYIKGDR